jgi:hypothetical protein
LKDFDVVIVQELVAPPYPVVCPVDSTVYEGDPERQNGFRFHLDLHPDGGKEDRKRRKVELDAKEIDEGFGFRVYNLIETIRPLWKKSVESYPGGAVNSVSEPQYDHDKFRVLHSDHHPVLFKAKPAHQIPPISFIKPGYYFTNNIRFVWKKVALLPSSERTEIE